jgi:CheY-like chemotaxis protein
VTDTGSGIPAEDLQGLFKPFSRFHERAYHIEGIGIGLTIAKGLLELMDGTIGVKSRRGRGSTFWIELKQGAEAAAVVPALNSPYRGVHEAIKNFTMLYIEDSPSHVGLMQRIVGAMDNIDMLTAHTAVLGLELARAHRPDLILCDISLPGMDGYELLQHLLSDESTRRIPVLAISANAMPNEVEKGLRAGFRHYLTKPLDVARFRATVFELLEEQLAERG